MSELSNDPPIQEEPDTIEESTPSGTLLVTMVLLIAGFLLAGTMMLHYGSKKTTSKGGAKPESFNFATLLAKGKDYAGQLKKPEKAEPTTPPKVAVESGEQKLSKLFGNRGDKVNWPKLKLTGFGSSTEGGGDFAIINGKQVLQGQLIDGKAKLTEIRSNDVMVEYMGETKMLTVDIKH